MSGNKGLGPEGTRFEEATVRIGIVAGTSLASHKAIAEHIGEPDMILHAGRIGDPRILDELARIAPIHAIVSQKDYLDFGDRLPEILEFDLCGARVIVAHMIGLPPDLLPPIQRLLERNPPDVIVHGHPPNPQTLWVGGTLFLAPGHAAPKSSGGAETCAILEIESPGRIHAYILDLSASPAPTLPMDSRRPPPGPHPGSH